MPQISDENPQNEFLLTDILKVAKTNGHQIGGARIENEIEICGANNLFELITLEKHFYLQQTRSLMLQGLTIRDPERFLQRGTLNFGKDIVIDVNVLIEGFVSIGNNAHIGANVIIADSEIGDNVIIDPYSEIRNQRIPAGTHVKKDLMNTTA